MSKSDVLIVSSAGDPHVHDMVIALREMGHEPICLNTNDIPLEADFSFRLPRGAGAWQGGIAAGAAGAARRAIELDRIRSVWWRRPSEYFGLPAEMSEQEREFAKGEIDHVLRGFFSLLDSYWVSYPEHIRQASWKMEQLHRAARQGFDVPATLITNDPDEVRDFYELCKGRMVFKVMTDTFLGELKLAEKHPDRLPAESRETKTTLITETELEEVESVRLVPCLFQEYVAKRTELRVTVIGDEVFAAEIDSQALPGTAVDWRNWNDGGLDIPYRKAALPAAIAERCLEFVRSYQLNFSSMDLVLTPEGRYVFLENNPNGQFIWVEKLVPELQMTAALASCLLRGANS